MSSFTCSQCKALCSDTETGYITGCTHYPPDRRPTAEEVRELEARNVLKWDEGAALYRYEARPAE